MVHGARFPRARGVRRRGRSRTSQPYQHSCVDRCLVGRLREPRAGAYQPVVSLATPADPAVGVSVGHDPAGVYRGAVGVSVLARILPHPRGPADGGAGGSDRDGHRPRRVEPAANVGLAARRRNGPGQHRSAADGLGPWGSPRGLHDGSRGPGAGGELACRASDSEPRPGSRRAGDVGNARAAWIPDGDGLRQQPRPHAFPLRCAAGEGSGIGRRKAPPVRRPQPGVSSGNPAKDPARHGSDPRPDPSYRDNLQPIRRYELPGAPLREGAGELRRPPVGAEKIITVPEDAAKTGG